MFDQEVLPDSTRTTLEERKRGIIARYGEWTDHNIDLGGVWTIGPHKVPSKLRRTLQTAADLCGKPLNEARVLDLACLEGLYAIEFARHGAQAVGIEGREANLAKANFAKDALGLSNLTFFQDDICNLSVEKYGTFDIVLCLGVYYHLDAPQVFRLAEQMYDACRRVLVMDTFVAVHDRVNCEYKGRTYSGIVVREHEVSASREQKLADLWASLDNSRSVWLTRPSLLNLLADVGFTSVYECHNPAEVAKPVDRVTIVAIKGEPQTMLALPTANAASAGRWPEHQPRNINAQQKRFYYLSKRITAAVPGPLRRSAKAALRSVGVIKRGGEPWEWDQPFRARTDKQGRDRG